MDGEKYQKAAASIRRAFRGDESEKKKKPAEQEVEEPGMFQSLSDRISESIRKRREKMTGKSSPAKPAKTEKTGKPATSIEATK